MQFNDSDVSGLVKTTSLRSTRLSNTLLSAAVARVRVISCILTGSGDATRHKISMCGMRSCSNYTVFNFIRAITVTLITTTII
jgi:hypothetical protein